MSDNPTTKRMTSPFAQELHNFYRGYGTDKDGSPMIEGKADNPETTPTFEIDFVSWSEEVGTSDDWEWAEAFIAEWLRIDPSLEPDVMFLRAEYLTEPEIAKRILDWVGMAWAENAPMLPPPGILGGQTGE